MKFMHKEQSLENNPAGIVDNFESCVSQFIDVMNQENKCIQEYDTVGLTRLSPIKKECALQYEKLINDVNSAFDLKILTKDDLFKISSTNHLFIEKTKENYNYLENSHEFRHRLMNIFFKSLNEIKKHSYTNKGESKFINATSPVALLQNL